MLLVDKVQSVTQLYLMIQIYKNPQEYFSRDQMQYIIAGAGYASESTHPILHLLVTKSARS